MKLKSPNIDDIANLPDGYTYPKLYLKEPSELIEMIIMYSKKAKHNEIVLVEEIKKAIYFENKYKQCKECLDKLMFNVNKDYEQNNSND